MTGNQEATSRALALAATPYQQSGARVDITRPPSSQCECESTDDHNTSDYMCARCAAE